MPSATRILCILIGIFCLGNNVFANIRGTPGVDYPNYSSIPITSFKCSNKETGFYADPETKCQVFHYCYENRHETFLCPIGTTFNQAIKSCDYWYSSECDSVEDLQTPTEYSNRFNDQPFVPVTSPPFNVFEKMVALHDSNGNSYKQNDLPVFLSEESSYENGEYFTDDDQDRNPLPTSQSNLVEIPQNVKKDLNFVAYDHEAVDEDDIKIVFSKDGQLNDLHNNPNFDYAEENAFNPENAKLFEPDNFHLSPEVDEMLHRMYQKEYSPDNQVKGINIDPNSSNENDIVSSFELNSDAMLHKRFSEVESKKRRIRRKPKYVILQTSFVENPDLQKVDPGEKTASSSKNTLVTYADGPNTRGFNENADDALQLDYGKVKRRRKPLRKDYSYSMALENVVAEAENPQTGIDGLDSYSDQTRLKGGFEENEISSDMIEQTSDSSSEDLDEYENANSIYSDKENDNNELYLDNSDLNDMLALNEVDFSDNQQLNIELMETKKSHLESDTMSSDEINPILRSDSNYKSYEEQWTLSSDENDFSREHIEENSDADSYDSNLLRSENSDSFNANKENSNSELYSKDFFKLNEEDFIENQDSNLEEQTKTDEFNLESATLNSDEINELFLSNNYQLHEFPDSGENGFALEHTEVNSDSKPVNSVNSDNPFEVNSDNPFLDSKTRETSTEVFDSNESSDSYSSTREFTETEHLDQNFIVDEFEENQNDELYMESSQEEPTSNNNNEHINLETESVIHLDEIHNYEADIKFERDGTLGVRANSKYLSFEETIPEHYRLNDTAEDYEGNIIYDIDGQETNNLQDTHTGVDFSVDSLEYFESEGQGYFVDEHGRIYIVSGENGESETLIYVGDINPEEYSQSDTHYTYEAQTENFPHTELPTVEESDFSIESEEPAEVDFDSVISNENEPAKEVLESQDNELAEDNIESVLSEDGKDHDENSIRHQENGDSAIFPEAETLDDHNSTDILQILEEADAVLSNLNQTNSTADSAISVHIHEVIPHFQSGVQYSEIKDKEMNVFDIVPEAKSDEMVKNSVSQKDSQFHLSSIPLPANAYEKGLYDEKRKNSQQDANAINSNLHPATFYKELQAIPNRNNPKDSKPSNRDTQTAELFNIKTGLFRNIKSDLKSDEVKSAVAQVGFPSKIVDNLFSSFSNPFQSAQGNVQDYLPLRSPKFRNVADYPTRTGKVFKPANIFKLINFGKKLLKMKQAKLSSLKEYISS